MCKSNKTCSCGCKIQENEQLSTEQSATGNVAGYQTPYAFSKKGKKNKATKYAEKLGMVVMSEQFTEIINQLSEKEINELKSLFKK